MFTIGAMAQKTVNVKLDKQTLQFTGTEFYKEDSEKFRSVEYYSVENETLYIHTVNYDFSDEDYPYVSSYIVSTIRLADIDWKKSKPYYYYEKWNLRLETKKEKPIATMQLHSYYFSTEIDKVSTFAVSCYSKEHADELLSTLKGL